MYYKKPVFLGSQETRAKGNIKVSKDLVSISELIYKGPDATRHGHEIVSGDIR